MISDLIDEKSKEIRQKEQAALIDVGFVVGYLDRAIESKAIPDENEGLYYSVQFLDELTTKGLYHEGQPPEEARRALIKCVGELKGRLWHTPIAQALSDALDRLTGYYANHWIRAEENTEILRPQATEDEGLSGPPARATRHSRIVGRGRPNKPRDCRHDRGTAGGGGEPLAGVGCN